MNGKRYYARIDLTKNKTFSLSDYGKKTLSRLTSPLTITYYRSPRIASVYPSSRDVYEYVKMYARENSAVNVAEKDPDASGVSDVLNRFGILPQTFRSGKGDEVSLFSSLVLEYEGKIQTIPFIVSADRIEYDLTRCVKNFVDGSRPRVLILTGNGMTLSEDYSYVVPWLSLQGFDCIEAEARTLSDYANGNILIVFGASKLSDKDAAAIEAFVLSGGSVLFAVSPYDADIKSTWNIKRTENFALIDLLSFWGISFESALISDSTCAHIAFANGNAGEETGRFENIGYPLWIAIPPQDEAKRGLTLFWANPVKIENVSAKPLVFSSPSSWKVKENYSDGASLFQTNPFALQNARAPAERKSYAAGAYFDGELSGMYAPEKKGAARIAVVADQYFAASLPLSYIGGETGDYRNLDFLTRVVLKLAGDEGLAELQDRGSVRTLYKTPDVASFSAARKKTLAVAFVFVPLFYAALVLFFAAIQKRRLSYIRRSGK
nr:GldG family protein [Treponema socranskii]